LVFLASNLTVVWRARHSVLDALDGCELLASDGGKRERDTRRIGHGGRGGLDQVKKVGVSTQSLS